MSKVYIEKASLKNITHPLFCLSVCLCLFVCLSVCLCLFVCHRRVGGCVMMIDMIMIYDYNELRKERVVACLSRSRCVLG